MFGPFLFTSFLTSYIAAETFSLSLDRLIIKDPQLPPAFQGLKVVFISDLHHGPFSSRQRLLKMASIINDLQPDLILLGGDYLQTRHRSTKLLTRDLQELTRILQKLHLPPLGIYAVLGNHDYEFDPQQIKAQFARAHVNILENSGVFLHRGSDRLRLGGVGDLWFKKANLAAAKGAAKADEFILILSHQPNFIDSLTAADQINFVLAGHTHGGQARIFNYQPFMPKKIAKWEYSVGLIETAHTRMLVSPGIGNVAPYFRFFSPPKIHLLTFKSSPRMSIFHVAS